MKKLLLAILFLFFVRPVLAVTDPLAVPNNLFGIHIVDENDLDDAAKLVNSTGGDWGYVKIVIREDDRNTDKWQNIFNRMRRLHLIPIVRLATRTGIDGWVKPRVEDIGSWTDFLNSLNWVIENRYVIIFNEPNHAKEWGGEVNPEEYGWYLKEFSRRLKEKSPDFFILPAGLDASAPNSPETMEESLFIRRMKIKEPDVFEFIDGWTSHSYPNPGFSGNPHAYGKGTIRTFAWEMSEFSKYGISGLPVFITETGWQHSEGKDANYNLLTPVQVADNYREAFTSVWKDPRIAAVVPFLLNYQEEPFDHFSFKKYRQPDFQPFYYEIQNINKISGKPKQQISAEIISSTLPQKLITESNYIFYLDIENTGQAMLDNSNWKLAFTGLPDDFDVNFSDINLTDPFQRTKIEIEIHTPSSPVLANYNLNLNYNNNIIDKISSEIELISPPSLLVNAKIWFNKFAIGNDYSVLFYDSDERLLQERSNLEFINGQTLIENLLSLVPNQKYRIVLTKPYFLPRQTFVTLSQTQAEATFEQLLPFDPSGDGKLDFQDYFASYKHPLNLVRRIISF